MNKYLSQADTTSDLVRAKIRKNELAAKDAMALIAKRHRKLEPHDAFEQIANTIGILAADLVRDSYGLMGDDLAIAMRDLVDSHMNRQIRKLRSLT
jgi:hypothetical protein